MESEHERAISNFQDQLQISEHEIEQLKIRIESLQQMNIDNEKLTETTQIGIKNDSVRDNILAWNVYERQQGEVNIHFYLIPCLCVLYQYLFSYLFASI
jgi:hypothetical protein